MAAVLPDNAMLPKNNPANDVWLYHSPPLRRSSEEAQTATLTAASQSACVSCMKESPTDKGRMENASSTILLSSIKENQEVCVCITIYRNSDSLTLPVGEAIQILVSGT